MQSPTSHSLIKFLHQIRRTYSLILSFANAYHASPPTEHRMQALVGGRWPDSLGEVSKIFYAYLTVSSLNISGFLGLCQLFCWCNLEESLCCVQAWHIVLLPPILPPLTPNTSPDPTLITPKIAHDMPSLPFRVTLQCYLARFLGGLQNTQLFAAVAAEHATAAHLWCHHDWTWIG